MSNWHNSPWLERSLFLLVLLIEAGIFFYLISARSVVGGHDGFQYFSVQYSFLNYRRHLRGDSAVVSVCDARVDGFSGIHRAQRHFPERVVFNRRSVEGC